MVQDQFWKNTVLAHFGPIFAPKTALFNAFRIFHGPKPVPMGSEWAKNTCLMVQENHLAEVVRSKPGRLIYGENATYPPILAFLGLFAYPTPRG